MGENVACFVPKAMPEGQNSAGLSRGIIAKPTPIFLAPWNKRYIKPATQALTAHLCKGIAHGITSRYSHSKTDDQQDRQLWESLLRPLLPRQLTSVGIQNQLKSPLKSTENIRTPHKPEPVIPGQKSCLMLAAIGWPGYGEAT